MSSVMAIVSKAVFEKMVGKAVNVGALVETDRYASMPAAFEQLDKGDAIFLITVRPPNEALWLVGILEAPTKQGSAWVGKPNTTPIRDVTPLVKKLKFVSGKGIEAKPGALAMSLQTPRILTDADVALLRGRKPTEQDDTKASAAVTEYRKQVDATPAGTKAKKQAAVVGASRFRFENYRKPFTMLKKLAKPQYEQLSLMTANNDAGKPEQCVKDEDWAPMELVDVVEVATGKPLYQLYVWPYGSGQVFEYDAVNTVAMIIQHGFELTGDDDLELRQQLAAANASADPPLSETIDFQLHRVKPKQPDDEKALFKRGKAAMERLRKALGYSNERYRIFAELTKAQQQVVRDVYPELHPREHCGNYELVGGGKPAPKGKRA